MSVKIKLCGLRSTADVAIANIFLPDYCGFVFAKSSRRFITPEYAAELRQTLDPRVIPVGVFVDESAEAVARLLETDVIDAAQLHGCENEDYIAMLRTLTEKPIIKAFHVTNHDDITRAAVSAADYVLLDGSAGGAGVAFDWVLARGLERKFFLAGGLNSENIAEAVASACPYAVDISSGVETSGVKDVKKVFDFMKAARGI
jgi:Phosphoribosylanthranilate isomerase